MAIENKSERFKKSFKDFLDKEWTDEGATADEWVKLFSEVTHATKQGSGLLWSDIKEIIEEVLR